MPEGPSIVILKEAVEAFKGKKITEVSGSTKKFDPELLKCKKITDFKSMNTFFSSEDFIFGSEQSRKIQNFHELKSNRLLKHE